VARILAAALNCRSSDKPVAEPCGICESCTEIRAGNAVDVIEIDAATNRGIDEIRELREAARYKPARDRFKIYILDEAHQIPTLPSTLCLRRWKNRPTTSSLCWRPRSRGHSADHPLAAANILVSGCKV